MTSAAPPSRWLDDRVGIVDLLHQGVPSVIGAYVLETPSGVAVVDCGPSSGIERLLAGMRELGLDPADLRHVIVTHIHLDHAGAAGLLLQRYPARLYVHEVGAPHAVDPSNLVRSATRIYGDQMGPLWGEVVPVPAERVTVITDGSTIDLGDRRFDVLYTPGHATHHVAFADRASGSVFAGDVAGVRIPPADDVWPPTPPPDIDVDAWHASIARLRALRPRRLFIAHFGVVTRVADHLDRLDRRLDDWVAFVGSRLAAGVDRDQIVAELARATRAQLGGSAASNLEAAFALATPHGMSVDGIARYLRKRGDATPTPEQGGVPST